MSSRLKTIALLWGLMWLGIGALAGLGILIAAALGSSQWRVSLGLMVVLYAGLVGGGTVAYSTMRSLSKSQARPFRLPPAWALGGGFVLALAAGLGLWRAEISPAFLMPFFIATVAMLAPLAVAGWLLGRRPGKITVRRGWVAYGLGATASTSLAYVLNALLPGVIVVLVFGLVDELLPLAEELLEALRFGPLTQELMSPWFLLALVEIAIVVPLVEEFVKPLPLIPLLRRLESPRDAVLLGALAGAGFAAVENLLYASMIGSAWSGVLLTRALGAALHPFGAGLMALAWWHVLRREAEAASRWIRNYGLAVGAHALWNGTCLVAAKVAHAWFQGWEVDLLGVSDGAVLLALLAAQGIGLLVALRALARRVEPVAEVGEATAEPAVLPTERAIAVWGLICLVVLVPVGLGALRAIW